MLLLAHVRRYFTDAIPKGKEVWLQPSGGAGSTILLQAVWLWAVLKSQKNHTAEQRKTVSVLEKGEARYWRHSGIGWINSAQTREPVWRKRWTMPKIGKTPWWPIWKTAIAVCPIISLRMQSDHSQLAGRTGCSVPIRKEQPPVLLCIQWLRWQKRMIWIPINIWHTSYHSGQTIKCQMNSWNSLPHGARLRKRTVKTKLE